MFFLTVDCFGEVSCSLGSQHSLYSSTCTFQDGSTYVKGVDGQVFKNRMEVSSMYKLISKLWPRGVYVQIYACL